jgi:hypothetical protein
MEARNNATSTSFASRCCRASERVPLTHGSVSEAVLEQAVVSLCGLAVEAERGGFELRHTVTRFRIRLHCTTARYLGGSPNGPAEYRWARTAEFSDFAFSMPARKFAVRLAGGDGRTL